MPHSLQESYVLFFLQSWWGSVSFSKSLEYKNIDLLHWGSHCSVQSSGEGITWIIREPPSFSNFWSFCCSSQSVGIRHAQQASQNVPAGCTGELQPLDLTFNEPFKWEMKECFTKWYTAMVRKEHDEGKDVSTVKPDIRTSTVKLIYARGWWKFVPNSARTVI